MQSLKSWGFRGKIFPRKLPTPKNDPKNEKSLVSQKFFPYKPNARKMSNVEEKPHMIKGVYIRCRNICLTCSSEHRDEVRVLNGAYFDFFQKTRKNQSIETTRLGLRSTLQRMELRGMLLKLMALPAVLYPQTVKR